MCQKTRKGEADLVRWITPVLMIVSVIVKKYFFSLEAVMIILRFTLNIL